MYPGNIGSTNQTAPRRVAFRKRSRGEKQNIPNCLRNVAAAMCSCFGCVLRQNQKGELEAASWAREWTMIDRGRCEEPTVLDPVFKTQNSSPGKLRKAFIVFDRNKRAWVSVSFGQVPEVKIITAPPRALCRYVATKSGGRSEQISRIGRYHLGFPERRDLGG